MPTVVGSTEFNVLGLERRAFTKEKQIQRKKKLTNAQMLPEHMRP